MSRLIQWQTRSEYSHAALVVPDVANGLLVVEAWQKSGVRIYRPTRHERTTQMDLHDVEVTPQEQEAIYSWASSQVGKKYDWKSVFRFVTRRRGVHEDTWFCSEFVFQAFHLAGVDLLARTPAWRVDPGLLARSPLLK